MDAIVGGFSKEENLKSYFDQVKTKLPSDVRDKIPSKEITPEAGGVTSAMIQSATQMIRDEIKRVVDIAQARCRTHYRYDFFQWFSGLNPIGVANAQIKIGNYSENDIRGIVIIAICMGIFFFLSTGALLLSKNTKVVAFAMDSVKTLLGFFIGVAMSFMGVR